MSAAHGTRAAYSSGCRCPECRGANAAYMRTRRWMQGARQPSMCSEAGCPSPARWRGLCRPHYHAVHLATAVTPSQEYVEQLVELGAEIVGIPPESVLGTSSAWLPAHVRQAVMFVLRERGWTLAGIGKALGRDHSSVYHAQRTVPLRAASDGDYAFLVKRLDEASRFAMPPETEDDKEPWVRAQIAGVNEVIRQAEQMRRDLERTLRVMRETQELVITRGTRRELAAALVEIATDDVITRVPA